ncbi:MAG: response regulator [Bacteroidota bacterium]
MDFSLLTTDSLFILLAFGLLAFLISYFCIPVIIRHAEKHHLMDSPNHRSSHNIPTPSMGGIAIVLAIILSMGIAFLISDFTIAIILPFALLAFMLLGYFDDRLDLSALLKLGFQIGFAITLYFSGFKPDAVFGLLGLGEIPQWLVLPFHIGLVVLLINAYNLIDGIDGLSGGILAINFAFFGLVFWDAGLSNFALICATGFTAVIAFLFYNIHPARIFMGDTGTLPLGALMSILSLKFLSMIPESAAALQGGYWVIAAVFALNAIPVLDTLRVFGLRISKRQSPFHPDKNHTHHLYLKNQFDHGKSSLLIHASHVCLILLAVYLSFFLDLYLLFPLIVFSSLMFFELNTYFRIRLQKQREVDLISDEEMLLGENQFLRRMGQGSTGDKAYKIALVDDDPMIHHVLAYQLSQEKNSQLRCFETGESLIDQLHEYQPDLLILDYHLNSINPAAISGSELLSRLHMQGYQFPTIFASAQEDMDKALELLGNKALDYIEKGEGFGTRIYEAVGKIREMTEVQSGKDQTTIILKKDNSHLRNIAFLSAMGVALVFLFDFLIA